jgi:hypothetical protein
MKIKIVKAGDIDLLEGLLNKALDLLCSQDYKIIDVKFIDTTEHYIGMITYYES